MRADRLIATVLLLQARGRITAAELAAELEVSVPTARRDLEALSAAGVPVYPQAGRGGGWQLLGAARTDLTGLTAGEAEALFGLLGAVDGTAAAAVRKLLRALPAPFRERAEAAQTAVQVDRTGWGEADRPEVPAIVATLRGSVVHRQELALDYRAPGREPVRRVVWPLGLVDKNHAWYLLAAVHGRPRTYRVDRIEGSTPTGEVFEPPAGIDPGQEWDRTVTAVEARRTAVRATIRASQRLLPVLAAHFGQAFEAVDDEEATVGAHSVTALAEQLAGWALHIEVTGPAEVCAELARIGRALVTLECSDHEQNVRILDENRTLRS